MEIVDFASLIDSLAAKSEPFLIRELDGKWYHYEGDDCILSPYHLSHYSLYRQPV